MSNARPSWNRLPAEIRNQVLSILPDLGCDCSLLATVSLEWQSVFEPLNFAEITSTPSRLSDASSEAILFRHRSQIRYIWYRIELQDADSPSDTQHWFKYLGFHPDTRRGECPSVRHEQGIPIDDSGHGWVAGSQTVLPDESAIEKIFATILMMRPFEDAELEVLWWDSLPTVPAISVVLLRQQTRRRWKMIPLTIMLWRFPNLQELYYEPWREWYDEIQKIKDKDYPILFESLHVTKLSRLNIFENFNESYPQNIFGVECSAIRVSNPAVSHELARTSLKLTTLSASFMADASYFFEATNMNSSWKWDNLTHLALTSRVLVDDQDAASTAGISDMLRGAAAAALRMPKLETMELWTGRCGLAMLFRYQKARGMQPAIITVRGTFDLALDPAVTKAWDAVASRDRGGEVVCQSSLIDPRTILSQGDAICQLGLSIEVIRPVSLQQILHEHHLRGRQTNE
ncbi:hypothetical protein CSOJ01_06413 [Colletotrichum sojae]|uniref:DUF6546 domain-containing protein n=1 Tax=Colletotrichum sojae TaxID=2175907 RepID=A0A8H6JC34_9PEZI|nr:hypothetical protein CSOJ01_06413 [Colletotrichum sojae]